MCETFNSKYFGVLLYSETMYYIYIYYKQITKSEVDEFDEGKTLPQCSFIIDWSSRNGFKPRYQKILLTGARKPEEITVRCFYSRHRVIVVWCYIECLYDCYFLVQQHYNNYIIS